MAGYRLRAKTPSGGQTKGGFSEPERVTKILLFESGSVSYGKPVYYHTVIYHSGVALTGGAIAIP